MTAPPPWGMSDGTALCAPADITACSAAKAGRRSPAKRQISPLLRRRGRCAGHGNFGVLAAQHAQGADGAHDLAVDHDRHAAFERRDTGLAEDAQIDAALGDAVLQRLGRPLEVVGGHRLADGDVDAGMRGASILEKATSLAELSTMAMATVQLFFLASASAAASAFLAASKPMPKP